MRSCAEFATLKLPATSASSAPNFGLTEGGVAAARAASLSSEDAAETKLFKPLGMASTSARYAVADGAGLMLALHPGGKIILSANALRSRHLYDGLHPLPAQMCGVRSCSA
jgi:hypothetical protein